RNPFLITARNERENYETKRRDLRTYQKVFVPKCDSCAVKSICDGIDVSYLEQYGEEELTPYEGTTITNPVHFRIQNPSVFMLKQKVGATRKGERTRSHGNSLGFAKRLKRRGELLRMPLRNTNEEMGLADKVAVDLMKRPSDAFHTGVLILRSLLRVVRM